MLQLPEIVIDGRGVHAHVRGAGRALIVQFHFDMQRRAVLDVEGEFAAARLGAGTDDGIDLPVLTGIGPVQFRVEDWAIEHHVRVQAGKGAHDVVGTKEAVAGDFDVRQPAFQHPQFYGRIGQFLLGHIHDHRHVTAFVVRLSQFGYHRLNSIKADIGAESTIYVGNRPAKGRHWENGVAVEQILLHLKPGTGVRGNHVNPGILCLDFQFRHFQVHGGHRLDHFFISDAPGRKVGCGRNAVGGSGGHGIGGSDGGGRRRPGNNFHAVAETEVTLASHHDLGNGRLRNIKGDDATGDSFRHEGDAHRRATLIVIFQLQGRRRL